MQPASAPRPRVLFVDDEQRVLNSMRIMFRREFDLFLASDGAEALEIVRRQDVDVIIADHRMPYMTGVEVLTKVRQLSPRTVRILLTGYADLDAVEGSINDGEVFRFLTKPCAPQQLRDTLHLAAKLAQETSSGQFKGLELSDSEVDALILENSKPFDVEPAPDPLPARRPGDAPAVASRPVPSERVAPSSTPSLEGAGARPAAGLGVIVFSTDENMIETVQQSVRGRLPVHRAANVVQVVKLLHEQRAGVLVTDVSSDKTTIQAMTSRLKQHLPELVTIAVSPHRDVLDMVWLINHGQIFRFLRKPLSPGRCAISLQAALQHHRMLLKNPQLVKRHQVESAQVAGILDGLLAKLKGVRRLWASA